MRLWLLFIGVLLAARRPRWEPRPSVVADYNLAVEALNALAFAPAEEVLRSVITADPDCGLCRQTLAIVLVRQDRPAEALQLLGPLSEQHPDRAAVFALSTIAALADQQPAQARSSAERAVALEPGDFGAQRGLLRALLASTELDAAAQAVTAASLHLSEPAAACLQAEVQLAALSLAGIRPLLEACATLGEPERVGEMALKLARAEGDLPAVLRLAREQRLGPLLGKAEAAEHLQAGELSQAMRLLDAELSRRPNDPDALLLRAWCWQALEQPAQAEEDLVRLLSLPAPFYVDEQGRVFTLHSRAALRRQALVLYVTLLVDSDRATEARRRLEAERPTLGEGPELAAAEVTLLLAVGEVDAA
ncbi:MAG: putative Zn-dependent protease, partial [Myxococcota bacterium]